MSRKITAMEELVDRLNQQKSARGDVGPNGEFYFHTAANRRNGTQELHTWVNENGRLNEYRYENGNMIKVDENWDMTPAEIKRRDYNRAYYQKRKAKRNGSSSDNPIGMAIDAVGIAIDGIMSLFK